MSDAHSTTPKGWKRYIPIAEWLPAYEGTWFRADALAAITVWALLVPEAMAYAEIAGVPPEAGLYAAPLALLGYALFGTSKQLNVGPSSTVAIISAAVVAPLALVGLLVAWSIMDARDIWMMEGVDPAQVTWRWAARIVMFASFLLLGALVAKMKVEHGDPRQAPGENV